MKTLSLLIKPSSSLCNLRCQYCFYVDEANSRNTKSQKTMDKETLDQLVKRIQEYFDKEEGICNISFQGGEPTLVPLSYYKYFIEELDKQKNIQCKFSIQTNGTLLNKEWAQLLKENNFLVGISLDGYKQNHDICRYDTKKNSVFYKILNNIRLLEKEEVEYNILTVVTKDLAQNPKKLYAFYKKHSFHYVQLIPCLPSLFEKSEFALSAQDYESFYKKIFDCWYQDVLNNQAISINIFENIAAILKYQKSFQCGYLGTCCIQNVIESNGDVYPCDFYCLDNYLLGNIKDFSFEDLMKNKTAETFLNEQATKSVCKECPYLKICHGACKRQNVCFLTEEYCAYQKVLEYCVPKLTRLLNLSISL